MDVMIFRLIDALWIVRNTIGWSSKYMRTINDGHSKLPHWSVGTIILMLLLPGRYVTKHPNSRAMTTPTLVTLLLNIPCWKMDTVVVRHTQMCAAWPHTIIIYHPPIREGGRNGEEQGRWWWCVKWGTAWCLVRHHDALHWWEIWTLSRESSRWKWM